MKEVIDFVSEQLRGIDPKDEEGVKSAASEVVSEVSSEVSAEMAAEAAAEAASEISR